MNSFITTIAGMMKEHGMYTYSYMWMHSAHCQSLVVTPMHWLLCTIMQYSLRVTEWEEPAMNNLFSEKPPVQKSCDHFLQGQLCIEIMIKLQN